MTNKNQNIYYLNTDGGSRNNPGPAAIGYVLQTNNQEIFARYKYLGIATNNEAEYQALLSGLNAVNSAELTISNLVCRLDSQLVVFQITGRYKIKKPELMQYAVKIKKTLSLMKEKGILVSFEYVPRVENKRADQLVNISLDKERCKWKN